MLMDTTTATTVELVYDEISPTRGILDPLGWAPDGTLLLLERTMLYNLEALRVWRADLTNGQIQLVLDRQISPLTGNTALFAAGTQAFLGFDAQYQAGYTLDLATLTLNRLTTGFSLPYPPASVFDRYSLAVIGIVPLGEIPAISVAQGISTIASAWLHWPLADDFRSITCYPDSAWTTANFPATCPGLQTPRQYPGHQGTDIGGRPNGLPVGTPVYAAAPGIVVSVVNICITGDTACNDAYGNTLLIEHTRVIDGVTDTWFTGYAHLQTILIERGTAISDIHTVIALSGDTGLGGAHLHFEVWHPHGPETTRWVDPWDNRNGRNLWVGEDRYPTSATGNSSASLACRTLTGNNIRHGPGTAFEVASQTLADTDYTIVQTEYIAAGEALGDWYLIGQGEGQPLGWIWSGLMTDCAPMLTAD
jgi:murein DD-endopeptidase MepM/ murein hydrolase activator NlpD